VTSVFAAHLGTIGEQAVLPQSEDTLLCQLFTPVSDAVPNDAAYDTDASKGCQSGKACLASAMHGMKEESLVQVSTEGIVPVSIPPCFAAQSAADAGTAHQPSPTARDGPLYVFADSSAHSIVKRE